MKRGRLAHLIMLAIQLLILPVVVYAHDTSAAVPHNHQGTGQKSPEFLEPKEWVQEKTGDLVPLDIGFRNEHGDVVTLRQLIDRPTLILPVYYNCPKLCSFDLANLADAIRRSRLSVNSYRVISLSINAEETPEIAALVKPNYIQLLPKDFPASQWTFLTGNVDSILRVTSAIGFRFKKKEDGTFIHPSALVAVSPEGRIIKYVYGSFIPGDVDLAVHEASKGTPVASIRRFIAFCFSPNPQQDRDVFVFIRIGASIILILIGGFFFRFLKKKL